MDRIRIWIVSRWRFRRRAWKRLETCSHIPERPGADRGWHTCLSCAQEVEFYRDEEGKLAWRQLV